MSKFVLRNMKSDYQGLMHFIPESKDKPKLQPENKPVNVSGSSGEEIKEYYENLLKDSSGRDSCSSSFNSNAKCDSKLKSRTGKRKRISDVTKKPVLSEKNHSDILKFAQNGDLSSIKNLIECGANINYQDKFGWTALMCASVEGHVTTVRFLLKKGADTDIINNSKQIAKDLARKSKRYKIVEILENWDPESDLKKKTKVIKEETYFCEICDVEYSDKIKHESSTAHLFNRQLKPSDPHFTIPESNKGFQLMLKHGWNKSTGLGSKGQGPKYPVKTVLKRDRQGFGGEVKQKSKVTHFEANDASAVERCKKNSERHVSVRTLSRREARYREKQDKNWEREMRHYFNSD